VSDYRSPWWPRDVALPGDPKFRESATRWLFAILPDGYSDHEVIRRYPSVAVALARQMLIARYEGTRHAYRTVRSELDEQVPPQYIEDLLEILRDEGVRLLRAAQGLDEVDRAMRGADIGPKSPRAAPWFPAAFWT
jgi:hypothetical protein